VSIQQFRNSRHVRDSNEIPKSLACRFEVEDFASLRSDVFRSGRWLMPVTALSRLSEADKEDPPIESVFKKPGNTAGADKAAISV